MGTVIKDRDRGMAKLIAQLRKRGARLHVGIPAENASREGGGPSNLEVATWNEFGTSRIPERSFIRATFDGEQDKIRAAMRKVGQLSVRKGARHDVLLGAVGTFIVGLIRQRIADGIPPANAESTIERKGSSKPLVATGQLRKAITSWVTK